MTFVFSANRERKDVFCHKRLFKLLHYNYEPFSDFFIPGVQYFYNGSLQVSVVHIEFILVYVNMFIVITKRKIGLTGPEVREYVDHFDVNHLSGDYAELLLRFLPTKDEVIYTKTYTIEFYS